MSSNMTDRAQLIEDCEPTTITMGPDVGNASSCDDILAGARHTLQRKARSRRVDVGNAYPAKSQLEGAVRDGSHN